MPRVYGNSPGQPISFQSCSATDAGVAIGLVSMPLTVVKSLFHGAFFVTSRRHAGSPFLTSAMVSREKSGSCSTSSAAATGAVGADFSRSRLRLIRPSYQSGLCASRETQRESGAFERLAAAQPEKLRGDVECKFAARAEVERAVRDGARVELAEEVAAVGGCAEAPDEGAGERRVDRQRGAVGDDEPVGEQIVRGDRTVSDRDSHRFLATSSNPGPNGIHSKSRSTLKIARTAPTSHRARPTRATDC